MAINAVFVGGFAWAGHWYLYLLLWVVPELTWHMFISRIRNIGEHGAVPDNDDRLRNTRTTHAGFLERALIAPYFVNYHLEHHLLVSCPCYRLPKAHALLIRKGFGPRMETEAQLPRDAAPRRFQTGTRGGLSPAAAGAPEHERGGSRASGADAG